MVTTGAREQKPRSRKRPRIAIVGGNFAGMSAARVLSSSCACTVIDPHPWFEFVPNIHELVSGVKDPRSLRLPRRKLVTAAGHRFVQAAVNRIDADVGLIVLDSGRKIAFDVCIVAVGGVNDTLEVPGAAAHAMPFKSVDNCCAIADRLQQLVGCRKETSVVVVGGGLEGVEALGEILRRYRSCDNSLSFHLVEASNRLLPGTPKGVDQTIRTHCRSFGVNLHIGQGVRKVTQKQVALVSGRKLRSDLTIWTGGVTAPPLLARSGLVTDSERWAPVWDTLQSRRFANVLVAGDAAHLPDPLSKQAYFAIQMGECAGSNAARFAEGKELRPFKPAAKPALVAFGDIDTFLITGGSALAGPLLAPAKEAVFHLTMAKFGYPLDPTFLGSFSHRGLLGIQKAVTSGFSLDALLRLPWVRIL